MSSGLPEDSFAALFENSREKMPLRRGARVGEILSVLVIQIGKEAVFVELDGHRQGFIEAIDLRAPNGSLNVTVGSSIRARVVQTDSEHGIRLVPTVEAAAQAGASVEVGGKDVGGKTEAASVKVAVGQQVSGTVHRVELYGVFIQIEGTMGRAGRGLVPTVELGVPRGTDLRKAFPLGTKLTTKVVDMTEGKMRLSVRGLKDDEERAQFDGFRAAEKTVAAPTMGTFGDLLRKARTAK